MDYYQLLTSIAVLTRLVMRTEERIEPQRLASGNRKPLSPSYTVAIYIDELGLNVAVTADSVEQALQKISRDLLYQIFSSHNKRITRALHPSQFAISEAFK